MKFILFSPLANTSAIGRVTALIAPPLLELGHELTVVRTEQAHLLGVPPHAVAAPVIDWTDESAVNEAVEAADAWCTRSATATSTTVAACIGFQSIRASCASTISSLRTCLPHGPRRVGHRLSKCSAVGTATPCFAASSPPVTIESSSTRQVAIIP